ATATTKTSSTIARSIVTCTNCRAAEPPHGPSHEHIPEYDAGGIADHADLPPVHGTRPDLEEPDPPAREDGRGDRVDDPRRAARTTPPWPPRLPGGQEDERHRSHPGQPLLHPALPGEPAGQLVSPRDGSDRGRQWVRGRHSRLPRVAV